MKHKVLTFILVLIVAALACSTMTDNSTTSDSNQSATFASLSQTQTAIANIQQAPAEDDQPAAVEAPAASATPEPPALAQASVEGASLAYDADLIGQLNAQVVEAALEGAYQYPSPRHAEFSTSFGNGVISMVPAHSYELVYDQAPGLIADLQRDIDAPPGVGIDCISQLPLRAFFHHCTHQEFTASPAKLAFANGAGLRFVTVYAIQDLAPVDNQNLRYVFQGLTNDGQCYVVAEFEVTNNSLPEVGEIPQDVYLSLDGVAADQFFGGLAEQLTANESQYSPELAQLDALIASIEVIQCGINQ